MDKSICVNESLRIEVSALRNLLKEATRHLSAWESAGERCPELKAEYLRFLEVTK